MAEKQRKRALKGSHIQIRVTEAQKTVLVKAATKKGLSLSSWILMVSLAAANEGAGT